MKDSKSKRKSTFFLLKIVASILLNALGYFLFIEVSTRYNPKFGNTFYIIIGCTLIALGSIYFLMLIKARFFREKKSKRTKNVFLKK
jgi:glucan phosphoethanolaminetransferase (alkaline phosphatase superfamily)